MIDIFETMGLSRSKWCVSLLLSAVLGYAMPAWGRSAARPGLLVYGPRLAFGQSVALTDFDGDSVIDQATLGSVGFSKSIRVSLSTTKKASVLQFTTSSYNHGSLFAYDTNNDGDVDLVWTDLVHPDDVVVWLNDGSGQFERVSSRYYADRFIVGSSGLNGYSGQTRELAVSQAHPPSLDQIGHGQNSLDVLSTLRISRPNQSLRPLSIMRSMAGRDPPATV
jgi:hypothetical protein